MSVLVLNAEEVKSILTMQDCIGIMSDAFRALEAGESQQPLRSLMWLPSRIGLLGMMPGYTGENNIFGIKSVSVFPENYKRGISSHQGVILLYEGDSGRLIAVLDAEEITAMRTAAVSALATDILARKEASVMAILGAGVQGHQHLKSISLVRNLSKVAVWDIVDESVKSFIASESSHYDAEIVGAITAEEAVADADIICTVTPAREPILMRNWVRAGTHVNAVGSCTPHQQELESTLVAQSRLYTDRGESMFNEPGDFLIPKREGLITEDHLVGELGELLTGKAAGRESDEEITLFKSLGLAIEDLATGYFVYEKAMERNIGTLVDL
jgi:ornithine cyclodeaminase